ncbi:hypothetical protein NBRC10512_003146 [Rhodotorula toruloides]|uniref:RHTO0S05e09296g1_1 n=2 Tax=Rhodotorula toruloides TaxID=5286 RepID=A0A061ATH7_RHOTO|nr:inositol metabolism protein Opi10 [Rhodotorula toruloides NP11]EMS23739.1 inositol metabolism protein Opi10 [Rhodotorula toruloides NP11]KAJ8294081.1 Protein Hikeshi [Rhodotorula toruloides]CDR40939.1 RHTO0S05e09296g1_1 [Rhodotorula toruloides]
MFAYVVPGRLVQPVAQIPDSPERFAAQIQDAEQLNHITIFLTGQAPFPEGYGCTIHLDTPGKGWQLIGGLTNAKPSAIFRLRNTFIPSSSSFSASFAPSAPTSSSTATLGILCEPLASVESQLSSLGQTALGAASNPANSTALVPAKPAGQGADPVALAGLVGKNLFNSVAGFAQPLPDGSQWIPLNTVERWYRDFERKLKTAGVGFLLRSD